MAAGAARAAVTAAAAAVRGRLAVRGAAVLLAAAMALPLGAQSAAGAADPATAAETSTAEQAPPGATAAAEPAAPAAGSAAEPAPPAEPATGDSPPAADAPATDPPTAEALIRDTLADDVDSASYYELVSELRRLGLDDSGGRRELQARLRAYHELPERAPAPPDAGRPIEIRAAHSAEQFTVEEIDETYVRLRGGVEVAVRDDERDAVHTIRAEELIFNQATRFLTARGGVEYTVTTPDGTDTVRADSLTLDSENFEAVFVDGRVQREHDSGAGPVLFTFSGDTFRHLADDTIILDGARVTSSPDPDTPNYEIRAERMWLLAPGEWAIRNATLYVGRIPVLWVPFYFRPGDRLVFHPAVGIRDREGLFINTTLYLRGRRPEEDSPFSLLRAQADRYREERHGLFLRPVLEEDATDRMGGATPGAGADQSFLKLMLDAYARLGVHAGVAGSYPELQVGEGEANVAFRAGVARSRSIWYDSGTGAYTAYDPATGESMWHDTSLFGTPNFPLRYALELDAGLALPYGTLRAGFQLFSDPDFDLDFGNRQERFNWPALVGFGEVLGEVPPQHRNLTWELSARGDLSPLLRRRAADRGVVGSLLVERVRLTTAAVRWFWRSRKEQSDGSLSVAERHDPTRTFYYPSTLRLPVLAAQVGGTLARFPAVRRTAGNSGERSAPAAPSTRNTGTMRPLRDQAVPPDTVSQRGTQNDAGTERPPSAAAGAAGTGAVTGVRDGTVTEGARPNVTPAADAGAAERSQDGVAAQGLLPGRPASPGTGSADDARGAAIAGAQPDLDFGAQVNEDGPAAAGTRAVGRAADGAPRAALSGDAATERPAAAPLRPLEPYAPPLPGAGRPARPGALGAAPFTLTLSYDLRPTFTVEQVFDSEQWESAAAVDFAISHSTVQATHTTTLNSDLDLYGGVLGLDHSLIHTVRVQQPHAGRNQQLPTRLEEWGRGATAVHLDNRLTLRPLAAFPAWARSAVTYDLDLLLMDRLLFGGGEDDTRETPDVAAHRLQALAAWELGDYVQRLTLSGDLPPLAADLAARLELDAGVVSLAAVSGVDCEDAGTLRDCNRWKPRPLDVSVRATPVEPLSLSQQLSFALDQRRLKRSVSTLQLGGLNATLTAAAPDESPRLEPRQLRLTHGQTSGPLYLWRNRINLDLATRANWSINFPDPTASRFTFTAALTLEVHRFLDLSFATASSNDNTHCYIAVWADTTCSTRNPLQDLWWSFAFWDPSVREKSNFKAESISLLAVHHLQDWDLTVQFSARPEDLDQDGELELTPKFSIAVQWFPLPEIRSRIGGAAQQY